MTADRMERVQAAVKREISLILNDEVNDPRIREFTITSVEITRDLHLAKVYYAVSIEGKQKEELKKGLKSAAKFIRKEIGKRLKLKYIPEISFREDIESEREQSIDKLFEKVEEELGIEPGEAESEERSE